MFDYQLIDTMVEDRVLWATIDAPPMNVMTVPLYRELDQLSRDLAEASGEVGVVVVQSADPDFFIAHFDVTTLRDAPIDGPAERRATVGGFHAMCERFRTMPVVSMAKIGGRVGGGGAELAASFDMRFGLRGKTILNQMEVPLGILPGGSGTQRIPRLVGRGRAMEIILGAIDVDADTAASWGWLNRCLDSSEFAHHVDDLARRIAGFPPHAVHAAKAAVLAASADPTEGLLTEQHLFDQTMRHPASRTAMERFLTLGGQTREAEMDMEALSARIGTADSRRVTGRQSDSG